MRTIDIIEKKKNGLVLSKEEINFLITGMCKEEIPDYQITAFLMAVYFQGMNDKETALLTMSMAESGEMMNLSDMRGIKVDKHSSGGVGDKTTMIVVPIAAACGVKVAKMSGRGLGHTGGTIDKLESIPNLRTSVSIDEFHKIVNTIGCCVAGQTGALAPADKKLYALRDVTSTVDSIPLIASSIMSKKIAAGADAILLDVKAGSGAFMKTAEEAEKLARAMVGIGKNVGRKTVALITDMDSPLGNNIGNSLEIIEAVEVLRNIGEKNLTELCIILAANMLYLADMGDMQRCMDMSREALESQKAYEKFKEMVSAQGGDVSVIEDTSKFVKSEYQREVYAKENGYIAAVQTKECGVAAAVLGAGREKVGDSIDYSAGITLRLKRGDKVCKGDVIAVLHTSSKGKADAAEKIMENAVSYSTQKPNEIPLVYTRVE